METLRLLCSVWALAGSADPHPLAAPGVTSLTNKSVRFSVPEAHYFEMKRGPVTAIVVDNAEHDPIGADNHGLMELEERV